MRARRIDLGGTGDQADFIAGRRTFDPGVSAVEACLQVTQLDMDVGWRVLVGFARVDMQRAAVQDKVRKPRPRRGLGWLGDRKSVVSGKSVSVRVDLGGGRIIKNKQKTQK